MFEETQETKEALRKFMAARRAQLKNGERDRAIAEHALRAFGDFSRYFVYLSVGTEVGTEELIRGLLATGKTVCVPKLSGGEMKCVPLTDKLICGSFGIPEPEEGEETACEVAFVPLLAADGAGNRVGYGKGYYDRYFKRHALLRVGLAYEGQVLGSVPHGEEDVPLSALVTERGVLRFGNA